MCLKEQSKSHDILYTKQMGKVAARKKKVLFYCHSGKSLFSIKSQ